MQTSLDVFPLLIIGHGSLTNIQKLTTLVKQMIRDRRLTHTVSFKELSSAYIMKNATCIFIRGITKGHEMLTFKDYLGPCHCKHRVRPRKLPLLLGNFYEKHANINDWNADFLSTISEKIISNLLPLRNTSKSPSIVDSLRFSASYGVMYVYNIETFTENTNNKMSLKDFEIALNYRRNRKQHERREFASSMLNQVKKVELSSSSAQSDSLDSLFSNPKTVNTVMNRNSKNDRKKNIVSSFYPGVFDIKKTTQVTTEASQSHQWKAGDSKIIDSLSKALNDCEFIHTSTITSPIFKVTFTASTSYSIEVRLDSALNLLYISQKPLAWVHGTLLDNVANNDPTIKSSHHIRIKVQTNEDIAIHSDLYLLVYPQNGISSASPIPPIEFGADDIAVPSQKLPEDSRNKITHIRQTTYRKVFSKENMEAQVSRGYNLTYSKSTLIERIPFCDLKLYPNRNAANPLRSWLKSDPEISLSDAIAWLHLVLADTIKVSEFVSKTEF
jgi:hypothetical protein